MPAVKGIDHINSAKAGVLNNVTPEQKGLSQLWLNQQQQRNPNFRLPQCNDGLNEDLQPLDLGDWLWPDEAALLNRVFNFLPDVRMECRATPKDRSSWHGTHVAGTFYYSCKIEQRAGCNWNQWGIQFDTRSGYGRLRK